MKVVISLGGSIIGYPPDKEWLKDFSQLVREKRDKIVAIVTGGGPIARDYIEASGSVNKSIQDMIGVEATMLNAWLLYSFLEDIAAQPKRYACQELERKKINLFGGSVLGGLTTDYVAVSVAERTHSKVLNITSVGGVLDENGIIMREIDYNTLLSLALNTDRREPGTNFPLDIPSILRARRSSIEVFFVGKDIEAIRKYLEGVYPKKGTLLRAPDR